MNENKFPSYKEMLLLNSEDFKSVLIKRMSTDVNKLRYEMSLHELETKSFRSTVRGELTDGIKIALNVFSLEEPKLSDEWFNNFEKETGLNPVHDAMLAKAASDHSRLGNSA